MDKHVDASACDLSEFQGLIVEVISSEKCHENLGPFINNYGFFNT